MGVVTVDDIDYGQIFGPFPTQITATDPAYVIGMLTNDKQADGVIIRVDTEERREGVRAVDWLPYVSPARDEEEQNMEAYLKEGGIFYRTLRIVKAEEELLVWYSKDFTQILGIPELQTNSKRDDEQFICTHCGEMFDFPYPLRAHLKFKCSFTTDDTTRPRLSMSTQPMTKLNGEAFSHVDTNRSNRYTNRLHEKTQHTLNYMTNNNAMFTISSKRRLDDDGDRKSPVKKIMTENSKPKKDFTISHSIEELSKSHVAKHSEPLKQENGFDSHCDSASAFRKVEKSLNLSPDNGASRLSSSPGFSCMSKSLSPSIKNSTSPSAIATSSSPITHIQPAHKSHTHMTMHPQSSPLRGHPSSSSMPPPPRPPMKSMSSAASSISHADPTMANPQIMGLYMPRIPLIPPPSPMGIPGGNLLTAGTSSGRGMSVPHSAFPDQIPPGLLEMCRATIPTVGPLTESFAANIRNSETLAKHALFADRHISTLGFLKSTNPMVEKLLQSTNPTLLSSPINALNLSQNWCAKCNATFRMTSDLVYHMRSHHKREFDPMKRKREEKLKCNICNETFRERHHLTRHMSSHA